MLEREIKDPRPIIPRLAERFEPVTQEVIETFLTLRDHVRNGDPAGAGLVRHLGGGDSVRHARSVAL